MSGSVLRVPSLGTMRVHIKVNSFAFKIISVQNIIQIYHDNHTRLLSKMRGLHIIQSRLSLLSLMTQVVYVEGT